MSHPFFDSSSYPWHLPEARRLRTLLFQIIPAIPRIDMLYRSAAPNLPPIALAAAPDVVWKDALDELARNRALRGLCDVLLQTSEAQNNADFRGAIQAVIDAKEAVVAGIVDDLFILDRVSLRDQKLTLLESDASAVKVLLVRGGPGSGKSYTHHLFERRAQAQGALVVYVDRDLIATVDELILQLFSALESSDKIPPRPTTDDAWYRAVCIKLAEVAAIKRRQLWLAVDDLGPAPDGAPLLDPEVRRFCDQLALTMKNPVFRQWFRLMLIHYPDGPVPTRWEQGTWVEERTSEADIQQTHVLDQIRAWLTANGRSALEEELKKLADDVIAAADAPPAADDARPRLRRLRDALSATLTALAGRPV